MSARLWMLPCCKAISRSIVSDRLRGVIVSESRQIIPAAVSLLVLLELLVLLVLLTS
jgi:hypothetical protein